jgi:nucleolar GTP-binding protein
VVLVINKVDVARIDDLSDENKELLSQITSMTEVKVVQISCHSEEGVMEARNIACDTLLAHRVDAKLKGNKVKSIINRIHVAEPKPRDQVVREPYIPDVVKARMAVGKRRYDPQDPERPKLERDIEAEEGGPGVYSVNYKSRSHSLNTSAAT